jgi:hypothetical protein
MDDQVNVIIEYPESIGKHTKFMITLKTVDHINTNTYSGDFVNTLIHSRVEEFLDLLRIIDAFGFVEVDNPLRED